MTRRSRVAFEDATRVPRRLHAGARASAVRRTRRETSAAWPRSTATRRARSCRLWCMGVNQHVRGTWMNNLLYNIHLLVGKDRAPGQQPVLRSPASRAPAARCARSARSTNRLPHGVVQQREGPRRGRDLGRAGEHDPRQAQYHAVAMFRALERGDIRFLWIQATNPMVTLPNLDALPQRGAEGRTVHRRLATCTRRRRPTSPTSILPAAMWIEREGIFGNTGAPHAALRADGRARRATPRATPGR